MDKIIDPLKQDSTVDVSTEEWFQKADAAFNARMADRFSYGQPGGYNSYVMEARRYESNLDPLKTLGYLHAQEAVDSRWDYFKEMGKAVYNGGVGVVRDTLNGIRAARDYNMAILRERSQAEGFEYNPDQNFIAALDSAVKVQALQPFEIKRSASTAGQFGLDLAQGAGQLVGQMGGALAANAILPGVGGLGLMVGQIAGSQYEDLKAKGVDPKRAAEASFWNAMVQAPFEYLSVSRLMKRIPAGSVLKKKLKMVTEDMATEGITEFIQQFPEEWAELWALNPDKSWKELREKAAKKFPDTLQNALYAGLIGGILGAGSRGIHIALDRNIDIELRRELHDETVGTLEKRINDIKKSGINPDYAAETINANLNNATVFVDGDVLKGYAQRAGAEKAAEKLGVSVETIDEAARKGDTVEISQGNFEAVAAADPSFFQEVKDGLSFDSKDISNQKYDTIQKNIETYSRLGEEQRKELKAEVDKIAATMEQAGVKKSVIEGWKSFFTAFALNGRPDNPAQFLRDNPLRFERGTQKTGRFFQPMQKENKPYLADEDGNIDYGYSAKEIKMLAQTPEGEKEVIFKPLPIRLQIGYQVGDKRAGAGYVHIVGRHADLLKARGYELEDGSIDVHRAVKDILAAPSYIIPSMEQTRGSEGNRFRIVKEVPGHSGMALLLEEAKDDITKESFYTVVSILPIQERQSKKEKGTASSFSEERSPQKQLPAAVVFDTPAGIIAGSPGGSYAHTNDGTLPKISLADAAGYVKKFTYEDTSLYQMAGQKALTANQESLNRAIAMYEESKYSPEEIFKETGWLRGEDGMWRFEIPDDLDAFDLNKIRIPENKYIDESVLLSDVYNIPELYEAYPWLKETEIIIANPERVVSPNGQSVLKGAWGLADYENNRIVVNADEYKRTLNKETETKANFIHEIQHLIQRHEGFARGGGPSSVQKQIENQIRLLTVRIKDIHPDAMAYYNFATAFETAFFSGNEDDLKQADKDLTSFKDNTSMTEEQMQQAMLVGSQIATLKHRVEKNENNPYLLYRNLAGEQEANATADRAGKLQAAKQFERREAAALERLNNEIAKLTKEQKENYDLYVSWVEETDEAKFPSYEETVELEKKLPKELLEAYSDYTITQWDKADGRKTYQEELATMPQPHDPFTAIVTFAGASYPMQTAYHGTGKKFERFNNDYMGTGEGNQVHGWGMYFSQDKSVAEHYRKMLSPELPDATEIMVGEGLSLQGLYDNIMDDIDHGRGDIDENSEKQAMLENYMASGYDKNAAIRPAQEDGYSKDVIRWFEELTKDISVDKGALYEVNVPENNVLLDEQKTLSEQSKEVQQAIKKLVSEMTDEQLEDTGQDVHRIGRAKAVDNILAMFSDSDGSQLYGTLSDTFGGQREASEMLNKYGVKGIAYEGGTDGRCFVVFDDNAISIMNRYYQRQQEQDNLKGSFDPFTEGEGVIRLFEGADASTVIHETGHYYIETLWREIEAGRASKQQQADFEKMMKYCGITTDQWAKMDIDGREAAHERLAEAIETYVMEDKAPTRELRPVFKRFAKWLKAVYSVISRNKNAVPLTDEVREVFDRMLSSQEDVEEMRRVEGYFAKLPSVITDNLSDATKKRIEDYILKAQDKAVELLTKERLANFREERRREIENYRNLISDEVRQEVAARPLYVAARTVRDIIGGEHAASAKVYATQYLTNKMEAERIVEWSIIAEQNGFTADELARKLTDEPNETEAYKAAMDEAVRKEYPDYYTEREQAEEAAREAMYNDESGILLGVEQQLIEDFATKAKVQQRSAEAARKLAMAKRQQAKVAAQKELARMKVKDATRVDRFIAAERRCAVKAAEAMAKKDYETARQYKDMQAFNHACVIESANMRKRIEQYQKFLKKQFRSKREAWTSEQHFNQAAALFARMGLVRKDYDPDTRTQSLLEYLNEMGEMLYPFNEIPDWLASDSWPLNRPTEMSFDDYEKVIDLIRYIRTMAKIEKAANFFDSSSNYQEWKEQAIENLNKLATKFVPVLGERQVASWKDKFKAAYQTLDNFLEKMDGWEFGFFSRSFGDAIKHCNDNEFVHLEAYQKRKAEIENSWCPTQEALEAAAKEVYYEELGVAANKFVLTKILMNLGNESNARKLCSSYPSEALRNSSLWVFENGMMTKDEAIAQTKENLLEFLGRVLTKEDIAYAQGKIDLAGMYWGEMAELDRRTRGFTPKKIEAYPVTIRLSNGEEIVFRGGYFPLIRNGEMGSHPAGILPVSETDAKQGKNVRTMYTDTGHMKARVEAEYPVDLTEGSEDRAMQKAIHDLCWRETMTDFRRILNDQFMFGLMKTKLGIADMTSFREMLEHAAQPEGSASMAMGEGLLAQTAGWLRRKTVNSIVMLNLRINLQNFGNFFLYGNSVDGFGYSDVIAAMGNAFSRGFDGRSFSEMWNFVDEKSAFMRSRSETPDITLADLREEGKLNKFERAAMEWGAKAMMYTDGLTARPVWVQAYTKKLNEGATEQEAIDFADTIIRRTLGSGRATDVSSLQRGGPVYKLFTAFQGFFNTQFNQWVREYNIDKRLLSEGNTGEAIQRITAFVASKYLAACLFNLVLALENPFDDDDDGYMNYTKELLHYPMSLVGIYGPVANFAMDKALGIRAYSYRMSIIESSLDKVYRASGKLGKMIDGDFESGFEGLSDVAGIYFGVPAQMNRLFWNAYDIFINGMDPELRDLASRRPKRER